MNAKQAIEKMVKILTEIDSLNEGLKEIKDEAKASELNVAVLSAVAKAIVSNKVDELLVKSNETLEAIVSNKVDELLVKSNETLEAIEVARS